MVPVQIMIMITDIPIRFLFPPAIWFGWTRRSMSRVMDWLYRAKPEELPEDRKILGELAAYFTDLRRQGPEAIEEPFFRIFGRHGKKSRDIRPFHVTPVTFPELIKALEEDMEQHFPKQGGML